MSKGLGKLQRAIMDKLKEVEYFYLVDLLPASYTEAQYAALYRAQSLLFAKDKVGEVRYLAGGKKILVIRPGASKPPGRPAGDHSTGWQAKEPHTIIKVKVEATLPTPKRITDNGIGGAEFSHTLPLIDKSAGATNVCTALTLIGN